MNVGVSGGCGATVNDNAKETDPMELLAVTVYTAWSVTTLGVPEITPVEGFNVKPVGNVGVTE